MSIRRSQVSGQPQQQAAATAQRAKADVRLAYTEIHAPIAGIVDVRAALQAKWSTPGQPVITLINPDDLWVRVDVEETYIDRVKVGDKLTVRLPSGDERQGTVFYRARGRAGSPHSATSAAQSATSRPSRSGCDWTTRTGAWPSA